MDRLLRNLLKSNIILLSLIMVFFVVVSCSNKADKPDDEVSDEVVLKIGKLEITRYEFEKDYDRELARDASEKGKEEWLKEYINKMYILADAYTKQYDTIGQINRMVQYAAQTRMARIDEYLWNYAVKPKLTCNHKEIKEARKKMAWMLNFEIIAFPNLNEFHQAVKNSDSIITLKRYNDLYNTCYNNKTGFAANLNLQWPFDKRIAEICNTIYTMKPGEISTPIQTVRGIIIVHMVNKNPFNIDTLSDKRIKEIVIEVKRYILSDQKNEEIRAQAHTVINYDIVNAIYEQMDKDIRNWTKTPSIISLKNEVAFQYFFKAEDRKYTLARFIDYFNNNPLLMIRTTREYIENMFHNIVEEEYLFDEAERLGVTNDKKYLLDRKSLLNSAMENRYEQNEFNSDTLMTLSEMELFYKLHLSQFKDGKIANVNLISFDDRNSAILNQFDIQSMLEKGVIINLCDSLKNIEKSTCQSSIVDRTKTDLPENMIDLIFNMTDNTVYIEPIFYKNKYVIIYKISENGEYVKSYDEVKEQIKSINRSARCIENRKQGLEELKNKYKTDLNKTKV